MSDYTGHIDPGGAAIRTLTNISIGKLSVGPMDNNCYLLVCRSAGDGVIIDAANDAANIIALAADTAGLQRVRAVITTHRHADHWQALADVAQHFNARTYAGADDAAAIPVPTNVPLQHGDVIPFGNTVLEVIALRGHTPGSVALLYRSRADGNHLFTGDSLFPGGPGKTANNVDFTSLMDDLEARIFAELPNDTWVYPGHGDDTTLGAERPQLAAWRARGW